MATLKQAISGKPKPFAFRPPRNNHFLIWLAKRALPLALFVEKIVKVEVSAEDLERLGALQGQRVVLLANHSQGIEPCLLFHLSKVLRAQFHYLAAKEALENVPAAARILSWLGIYPWLLQRLGAFSIVRGTPDRSSFRMTRQLLAEGKRWLVVFPEGEVSSQNDNVMPFHQGIAQFAFWACEDLDKQGELPPMYFVPMAIKFVYLRDMRPDIDRSLRRLEKKLFAGPDLPPLPRYDRLRRVGEAVLVANEKEYHLTPPREATLNDRVQQMKEKLVGRVTTALEVSFRPEQPLLERIRDLFNLLDRLGYAAFEGPEYERRIHERRQQEIRGLYEDLWRALHFVALYDGYVRETLTAERFLDLLGLLEHEVFRKKRIWGPRKAVLRVGEPVNLAARYPFYQADKRTALQEATKLPETCVRQMLSELSALTTPIEAMA